jgi:prephenate dehydratase
MSSLSAPYRLGSVVVGGGKISLLVVLPAEAETWTEKAWTELRELGVCAVLAAFEAPVAAQKSGLPFLKGSGPWKAKDGPELCPLSASEWPVHDEGAWFLDARSNFQTYPERHRRGGAPWGWMGPSGVDAMPLALAACAAGAELLVLEVESLRDLVPLLAPLKGLAAVLGRELTRIPKEPEGRDFRSRNNSSAKDKKLFDPVPGHFRVAYQGEPGAYSEMAVFNLFPPARTEAVPHKTFREAFEAVESSRVDFAMIPFENALAGPVQDSYDLLLEFAGLSIVAETQVRVEHNLIGLPGASLAGIRRVFSHPQALAQSRKFLESHPEWEGVPSWDTAGSVGIVANKGDPSWAAIASAEAARVWGMEILSAGVETNHHNFTRFFLLAPKGVELDVPATKASVLFSTPDTPGALSRCLAVFATFGLNMKKLESRPIHGQPWEYMFYVDVELPSEARLFAAAWEELEKVSLDLRLLGRYPGALTSPAVP